MNKYKLSLHIHLNTTTLKLHLGNSCHAPLHEDYLKHHEHKGDLAVTRETYDTIGERAQVILVWVRAPSVENASHTQRLEFMKVRP